MTPEGAMGELFARALVFGHAHRNHVPGEVVMRALQNAELREAIQALRSSDAAIAAPHPHNLHLVLSTGSKPHPLRHGHAGRFNR